MASKQISTASMGQYRPCGRTATSEAFVHERSIIPYPPKPNTEAVPVSGRRRFNCFNDESVEEEGKMMYDMIMREQGGRLLPQWDRRTRQVKRVMERLIPASGVSNVEWEVHVIDSPERNAFVIPGGKVFVYSGILPITKNDDGLAAVLGHEIAHNVARHQAETLSSMVWLAPLRWLLIVGDSTGYTMGLGRFLGDLAMQFGIMLPASRKQENEADYIGLMMMAKSCYDPSEAVRLWQRMEVANKEESDIPQWLSTHPSNANRITQMQQWLAEAENARQESGCAVSLAQSSAFQDAVLGVFFGVTEDCIIALEFWTHLNDYRDHSVNFHYDLTFSPNYKSRND
ncbi:hypothetical protein EG329_007718 [Mollisiaceae sp. DMI_Dod_QoI]|nr:hypothetical protein EG329_007718 [Helotiales sp. DMI_Dod_QoI]